MSEQANVTVRNNNEVELSNDLGQLTKEIKQCQAIGNKAIFEMGRRIRKVKNEDMTHGEFGKWTDKIGMDRHKADKLVKIYDELSNGSTSTHLGFEGLYQIATMPAEDRDKEYQLDNGKTKKPADMTVKEIREVKRKNKGLPAKPARQKQIEVKPEIEQTAPDSDKISELESENKKLKDELAEANNKIKLLQSKADDPSDVEEAETPTIDPLDIGDFHEIADGGELGDIVKEMEKMDEKLAKQRAERIANDTPDWRDIENVYFEKVGQLPDDGRINLRAFAAENEIDKCIMYRAVETCAMYLRDISFDKNYDDEHKFNGLLKLIEQHLPEVEAKKREDDKVKKLSEEIKAQKASPKFKRKPYKAQGHPILLDEDTVEPEPEPVRKAEYDENGKRKYVPYGRLTKNNKTKAIIHM